MVELVLFVGFVVSLVVVAYAVRSARIDETDQDDPQRRLLGRRE
jgi:hypothetical protein